MLTLFANTTPEMARKAKVAINDFMAHWNDGLEEQWHNNQLHGATVRVLQRILATPEQGETTTLWCASFHETAQDIWFQVDANGQASFPGSRMFTESDLVERCPKCDCEMTPEQVAQYHGCCSQACDEDEGIMIIVGLVPVQPEPEK